jgi:transposase
MPAQSRPTLLPLRKQLAQQCEPLTALEGSFPGQEHVSFDLADLTLPADLPLVAEAQFHAARGNLGVAISNRLPRFIIEAILVLFHLSPYSPELNPDELVWNNLKNHGTWRRLVTSPEQRRQTIASHMRQLQKLPALVRSFFHVPTTCYASARWQLLREG